ncbi:lysine N(6)-hydroxylase/L-ornithine N(5)-oxygenase family protein [Priestia endophytica]|uniref:L-lysine N6-monooxygenase MbtG n=1 Tax=Priestia endophytica TaxID=135735 RepID=A0AAX1Q8H4_9BACI|nr:lysine N(6)-hydroxylase/L-ornithine N(5)-oxygenase family protein [Priestia endophytica]RAS75692.1 lysine 6-monooxygenase [Priestia endophytica]RAS82772.1 lysine 6-monooxygenase [Priestia endophytica]
MDGLATKQILDVIGIGIGPFNLGLAALLEKTECKSLFFDKKLKFEWHPGMLLEGTTLQVPFMADAVTMVDPTSKFNFLNYLHEQKRLYQFYFLEKFHIPRNEYNHYCQWVAEQLTQLQFDSEVEGIERTEEGYYRVEVYSSSKEERETYVTKHIVLGIGTKPYIPERFQMVDYDRIFHSSDYMKKRDKALDANSVTVIGSGQSAAEIFYDLLSKQLDHSYELSWYTRSKGFYPMEYSKLGLEHFSPDYTNYFYKLPQEKKQGVLANQSLLYKGISFSTIADIYDLMYERSVSNKKPNIHLQALTELVSIEEWDDYLQLSLYQYEQEANKQVNSDVVILATGYHPYIPGFLKGIESQLEWDENGQLQITEGYKVKTKMEGNNHLFVQNGELHTHGVGAPDLGLGAFRSATIINQIAGKKIYQTYEKNAFQQFGM